MQLLKSWSRKGDNGSCCKILEMKTQMQIHWQKAASEANKIFQELELTEKLTKLSIEEEEVMNTQEIAEWMKPIIQYLKYGTLPEDKLKARKLKIKVVHYSMYNGELYRRSLSHPWLKCVSPEEGNYVLKEIHEGICKAHEA